MKEEVKKKWVEALRSGKYKQTHYMLRDGISFCCLGVLCDISELGEWDHSDSYLGMRDVLPIEVSAWAGLPDSNPCLDGMSILSLNDDEGYNFTQIADMIEEHL